MRYTVFMDVMLLPCLFLALALPAGDVEPELDTVELHDGRELEGRVVFEDEDKLVLRVRSREQEIDKDEVSAVRAAIRELPKALDEVARLQPGKLIAHHALAEMFDGLNLPYEARLMDWLIVDQWPDDELAHERLDNRRKGKGWAVRHSGRWVKLEDRKAKDDWKDAWELRSTHFKVRSNLPLRRAVMTTLDLERAYQAFYGLLGDELELWEITEPIEADLHASASSFPESFGSGRSYFLPSERRLYVNASGGTYDNAAVHEATHALLFFSAVHTRSGRGDIPGWLDEGLAEYMQAGADDPAARVRRKSEGAQTNGGGLVFDLGKPNRSHFIAHAHAKDPYKLTRVLNFQSDDFGGTSNTQVKYAQSYTLVYFLLHGSDGAYRDRFFEFLRKAYTGKSSSTTFKKVMDVREKDLEREWSAYVTEQARR